MRVELKRPDRVSLDIGVEAMDSPRSTFYFQGLADVAFAFEKLIVYQKAIAFADAACATTEAFPRGYGFLADQLNRASVSIAANIAEGNGRFTVADRRNFFGIARGSVQECVALLEITHRRSLMSSERYTTLRDDLEEIAKMLSGLITGLENRQT